ncbi:MAG TPA: hypothetical protein VHU85_11055 [Acidimicrobiales bacterium]|nr:hypothetical protein [Acidimicrobiales bacterium]
MLAGATFSAVRSSGRAARIAEEGLRTSLRPLLIPSLADDPVEKHRASLGGGRAVYEFENDVLYVALGVRNAGSGIALLHGWHPYPDKASVRMPHADPEDFRRFTVLPIDDGGG